MAIRALTLAFPIVFVAYNAVQGFLRMDPENTADGSADIRSGDHQPTARISAGIVQGFSGTSRDGRTFYQFLGMPYAQPPVGDLRFESPLPVIPWTGTLIANQHQNPCLQLNFITGLIKGSEDCLYLNVFTPRFTSVNGTSVKSERESQKNGTARLPLLPVMVFIYGGYFMYGAAHHYGPTYFMDHDVVLVTFNYRVGALGFLNTGDRIVRGNMGLKDQNMVLRWVQENIAQFGGDPTRVTLFGESAGASSVHFHILSPMSAGLFHKAISQSGTAVRTWQVVSNPGDQARKLGKILECPTQSTREMVSCLKGKDGSELVDAHINRIARLRVFQDLLTSPLAQYAPSVEGIIDDDTFLAHPPMDILKSGNFSHVPWICGVNSEEGLVYSARITRNRNVVSRISRDWKNVAPILLNYDENRWEVADRLRMFQYVSMQNMLVYAYYFSYVGEFTFYNLFKSSGTYPRIVELGYTIASNWVKETIFRRKRARYGVCHGDDLPMFFNLNLLSTIDRTEADYPMSQIMTATWVQFAYNDTKLRFRNYAWPRVNPKDVSPVYMLFNDTNPRLIREPFTDRARFWEGLSLVS